jgi:translation initiation factor 6 (eIF-6)
VSKELYKLGELEARLLRKRFGIDLPYQLSIIEIAESENMNPNKVKYIITSALKTIGNNISAEDKQIIISLIE